MKENEPAIKVDSKFDNIEEYAYLKQSGFSSEAFKIEIRNFPKYYGYSEVKKLITTTLGLNANKIKIPRKNCVFGFVCFHSEEGN